MDPTLLPDDDLPSDLLLIEDLHCVHQAEGLCPSCLAEYREDPLAWLEFGRHAEGEANWAALLQEMAEEMARADGRPR